MRSVGWGSTGASEQNIRIRTNNGRNIVILCMCDYMDKVYFVNKLLGKQKGGDFAPFSTVL